MKKVMITGPSGFIARALKGRLEAFPGEYRVGGISFRETAPRAELFSGWDCVVHTAGIAHVISDFSLEADYMRVNRDLTLETARRAKEAGVHSFVFLSSMIVYGDAQPVGKHRYIDVNTVPKPSNIYGKSKLEAEEGLRALSSDSFHVSILRPPMVYGKGCKGNYNRLAKLAMMLPFFPNFGNQRSTLYVENLTECIRIIIDECGEGVFFPCNSESVSTAHLAGMIAKAHGRRLPLLRSLNPAVVLMGRLGIVRRAFGDMAYAPGMGDYPEGYRRFGIEESIRRTEID